MNKSEKKWNYLLFASYAVLLVFLISVVMGNNSLYGDGGHHLMTMMLDGNLITFHPHRGTSIFLSYGFVYFAMKIGVTSVKTLVDLYSFGYSFWICVFYILALTMCYRKKNYKLMCLSILYFCFVLTNSGFMTVIQSNITAAWFWCCFTCIYLYTSQNNKHEVLILILAFIGININEYTLFLNLVLIALVILKLKKGEITLSKWWYLILLSLVLGFLRAVDGTFINPDIDASGDLLNCIKIPAPLLWAQLITLALLLILLLATAKRTYAILDSLIILIIFCVCAVCIWRIIQGTNLISYTSNVVRIYNLIIPILLGCYLILEQQLSLNINEHYFIIPVIVFLSCFSIYIIDTTNAYQVYGSNTAQFCKDHDGLITRAEVTYDSSYNWGWTSVEESILLQAYYGNTNIHCVITCDEDDPVVKNMDDFSAKYGVLQKYNIYFDFERLK